MKLKLGLAWVSRHKLNGPLESLIASRSVRAIEEFLVGGCVTPDLPRGIWVYCTHNWLRQEEPTDHVQSRRRGLTHRSVPRILTAPNSGWPTKQCGVCAHSQQGQSRRDRIDLRPPDRSFCKMLLGQLVNSHSLASLLAFTCCPRNDQKYTHRSTDQGSSPLICFKRWPANIFLSKCALLLP